MTTVTYNGQRITEPGWIRASSDDYADLYWPGGQWAALCNTRLGRPVRTLAPSSVHMDGETLTPVTEEWSGGVEYGQMILVGPREAMATTPMPRWYWEGVPSDLCYEREDDWGWRPRNTTAGGSQSLYTYRIPGAVASSLAISEGRPVVLRAAVRRLAQEMLAGVHFEEDGVWWTTGIHPTLLPYGGYTKSKDATGGPSTLYGAKLPAGMDWPGGNKHGTGWMAPDPDHHHGDILFAMERMLESGLDDFAAITGACLAETLQAINRREDSTGGRGHGHAVRVFALRAVSDLERAADQAAEELVRLKNRNHTWVNPSGSPVHLVFRDRGNSTDSYHMPPSDVEWITGLTGVPSRDLARSCCTFMAGITLLGLDTLLDAIPALSRPAQVQYDIAMQSLHLATGWAYDVKHREYRSPGAAVMWDDIASPIPAAYSADGDLTHGGCANWRGKGAPSESVGDRFIKSAVRAYVRRTGNPQAHAMIPAMNAAWSWKNVDRLEVQDW